MKIKINKDKMWNYLFIKYLLIFSLFGVIIKPSLGLMNELIEALSFGDITVDLTQNTIIVILAGGIFFLFGMLLLRLYNMTLEYAIDTDKNMLLKSYKIITKTKDSARLQVINSVDITQGLFEKLFGLFSVTVSYGFGDEGYYFVFHYLSEKEADKLMDTIRPTGKMVCIR